MADFGKERGIGGTRESVSIPTYPTDSDIHTGSGDAIDFDIEGDGTGIVVFNSTTKRFSKGRVLFTGTVETFSIYDRNILSDPNNAVLLIQAVNVYIGNGEFILTQDKVSFGVVSSLAKDTDYWFYLFNEDLTVISVGVLRIPSV